MKNSIVIPAWAIEHNTALLEEMSATQVKNMMGQYLSPELKEAFKKDLTLKSNIENTLRNITNEVKAPTQDEKPTLIWLVKQVSTGVIDYTRIDEDKTQIIKHLTNFYKYRRELKKKLVEYTYATLKKELGALIQEDDTGEEKNTLTDFLAKPWRTGGDFKVYEVTNVAIANKIAEGTSWCTQGEHYANHYIKMGPLYVVYKNRKRFAQLHFHSGQFMDVHDEFIGGSNILDFMEYFSVDFDPIAYDYVDQYPLCAAFLINPSTTEKLLAMQKQSSVSVCFDFTKDDFIQIAKEIAKKNNPRSHIQVRADKDGIKIVVDDFKFFYDKFNVNENDAYEAGLGSYEIETILKDKNNILKFAEDEKPEDLLSGLSQDNIELLKKYLKQQGAITERDIVDDDQLFQMVIAHPKSKAIFDKVIKIGKKKSLYGQFLKDVKNAISFYFKHVGKVWVAKIGYNQTQAITQMYIYGVNSLFDEEPYDGGHTFGLDENFEDYNSEYVGAYFRFVIGDDNDQKYKDLISFQQDDFDHYFERVITKLIKTPDELDKEIGQGHLFEEYIKKAQEL